MSKFILAEFECVAADKVADAIEAEKRSNLEIMVVLDRSIVFYTSKSPDEVRTVIHEHNRGMFCECKVITEQQYDDLC